MLKNMSVRTFISCFLLCVFLMDTVLVFYYHKAGCYLFQSQG